GGRGGRGVPARGTPHGGLAVSVPILEIRGLGKSYLIPQPGQRWAGDFADAAVETMKGIATGRIFRRVPQERFWALRDVGFQVHPGEVVALAGHNGAGKSTLLKVLSRITAPSEGEALVRGRIGSLLEVGTGFHQDLTGRENVYLAATILGMRRAEVQNRFDEIVAFAEMESFIDMQVKRYSSGMYLRLAFSVAAHLSTEVLLIDEALAVGDVNFQRKCMGKMGQIAGQGRTVLFVSHSVSAMRTLCSRGILLDRGRLVQDGDIDSVVQAYLAGNRSEESSGSRWVNDGGAYPDPFFRPMELSLSSDDGWTGSNSFQYGSSIRLRIAGTVEEEVEGLVLGIVVTTPEGVEIFRSQHRDCPAHVERRLGPGEHRLEVVLPSRLLNEGDYRVELVAALHGHREILAAGKGNPGLPFSVHGGFGRTPYWIQRRPGVVAPELEWTFLE
ncbi:MAG TPA: polysaccharide ABC transporter ATP-binding protein, partial [Fibrobacteria bacterium]|nr:polysaccharide ABC transporter ATP-binding protein [Fibrobacteria bacterium]